MPGARAPLRPQVPGSGRTGGRRSGLTAAAGVGGSGAGPSSILARARLQQADREARRAREELLAALRRRRPHARTRRLAMNIGDAREIGAVDDDAWEALAGQAGYSKRFARRTTDELVGRVIEEARSPADDLRHRNETVERIVAGIMERAGRPLPSSPSYLPPVNGERERRPGGCGRSRSQRADCSFRAWSASQARRTATVSRS